MINSVKVKPRERYRFNERLIEVAELRHSSVLFRYVDKSGMFELSRAFVNKYIRP